MPKMNIACSNLSYEKVKLLKGDIIYCDIPYEGTNEYAQGFNKKYFLEWCLSIKQQVYISEQSTVIPKGFKLFWRATRKSLYAAYGRRKVVNEYLITKI